MAKRKEAEYFIMHRKGNFAVNLSTRNQCKVQGHRGYNYHLRIVVTGGAKSLDKQGFIVDHVTLDAFITGLGLHGSCEQMQIYVANAIPQWFKANKIKCKAYRLTIQPIMTDGTKPVATMEYVKALQGRADLLPLLMGSLK